MRKIDLNVTFGNLSVGDDKLSIGCKIPKEKLKVDVADGLFAGRRLSLRVTNITKAQEGQKSFEGMDESVDFEGSVDVKSYRTAKDEYSISLKFFRDDVDEKDMLKIAKKEGRIVITANDDLPEKEPKSTKIESLPGQQEISMDDVLDGDTDTADIDSLDIDILTTPKLRNFTGDYDLTGIGKVKVEAIKDFVRGKTLGKLLKKISEDEWWHRNIDGIGQDAVDKISDAIVAIKTAASKE